MKVCSKCKRELPLSAFGKRTDSKDGLHYMCRECHNQHQRNYSVKNREKRREYNKRAKAKRKLLEYYDLCDAVGGYKMFILNHIKNGEYKYNVVNTVTQEVFKTNNKDEFIRFVKNM